MRALLLALILVLLSGADVLGQDSSLAELERRLQSGDRRQRGYAISGLSQVAATGSNADRAVRLIGSALGDPDPRVRRAALRGLVDLGPKAAPAIAGLIDFLDTERLEGDLASAVVTVGRIGADASAAADPVLRIALNASREPSTRLLAIETLAKLERTETVDRGLLELSRNAQEDRDLRWRALTAYALGRGADPRQVLPALVTALHDADERVRLAAVIALKESSLTSPPAAPALANALSDPDRYVRNHASLASEQIGEPALPFLVEPVVHTSERESKLAAEALEKIGQDLEQKGKVCWWVIPRVFRSHLIYLALALLAWVTAARRFPRQAPASKLLRALQIGVVVGVPVVVAGLAVNYAATLSWSSYYLPKPPLALVSPAWAATLSAMFLVALPGAWAHTPRAGLIERAKCSDALWRAGALHVWERRSMPLGSGQGRKHERLPHYPSAGWELHRPR